MVSWEEEDDVAVIFTIRDRVWAEGCMADVRQQPGERYVASVSVGRVTCHRWPSSWHWMPGAQESLHLTTREEKFVQLALRMAGGRVGGSQVQGEAKTGTQNSWASLDQGRGSQRARSYWPSSRAPSPPLWCQRGPLASIGRQLPTGVFQMKWWAWSIGCDSLKAPPSPWHLFTLYHAHLFTLLSTIFFTHRFTHLLTLSLL